MQKETLNLCGLDLETLSLDATAVVFQVGLAFTTIHTSYSAEPKLLNIECESFGLPILPQLLNGGTVSEATMKFHRKILISRDHLPHCPNSVAEYFHQSRDHISSDCVVSMRDVADELRTLLSSVDEIWVNHPEFDIPKLKFALREYSSEENPLFHFRKIRDVHTVRKSGLRLPEIQHEGRELHDAARDAEWNVRVACAWHDNVARLNALEYGVLQPVQIEEGETRV
jgi:hypothetical protein